MSKRSKDGFAFLLFGIMLSNMVFIAGALQWVAIVGWILGFAGLMMVLGDDGKQKDKNPIDDSKAKNNNNSEDYSEE